MIPSHIQRILQQGIVIPAHPLAVDAHRRLDERRQRALSRYYIAAGAGGQAVGVHTTQFAIRDPAVGLFRPVLTIAAEEMDRADRCFAAAATSAPQGLAAAATSAPQGLAADGTSAPQGLAPDGTSAPRGLAADGTSASQAVRPQPLVRIAGLCGPTAQATAEAELIRDLGYHAGLLSLAAMRDANDDQLIAHCRAVAEIIPLVGFYLQPAVGGRILSYRFWRRFAEIENVVAVKIAPFNRYQTIDTVRAIAESGRDDIALYTGNDDNIVMDLLTPYRFTSGGRTVERRFVGGLLGHWAVWTQRAVELLHECHRLTAAGGLSPSVHRVEDSSATGSASARREERLSATGSASVCQEEDTGKASGTRADGGLLSSGATIPAEMLRRAIEVTDANAAFFDSANGFAGCIAGLHEVLRRQGLFEGIWCLNPSEGLSPGQREEIDRVYAAYPHLNDDRFVAEHRDEWLRP